MINISICDDNIKDLKKACESAEKYLQENQIEARINKFAHPDDLLSHATKNPTDIYILDIVMPMLSGIEVGKEIKKLDSKAEIIYSTTSKEHAIDAFSLDATHYITKPYEENAISTAMDRAFGNITKKQAKKISLPAIEGGHLFIDINDIIFLESQGHYLKIIFNNAEEIKVRKTLGAMHEIFEELSKGQFIMPYKGYIVNQNAIVGIGKTGMKLKHGHTVPVPQRNWKDIQNKWVEYMFEEYSKEKTI